MLEYEKIVTDSDLDLLRDKVIKEFADQTTTFNLVFTFGAARVRLDFLDCGAWKKLFTGNCVWVSV